MSGKQTGTRFTDRIPVARFQGGECVRPHREHISMVEMTNKPKSARKEKPAKKKNKCPKPIHAVHEGPLSKYLCSQETGMLIHQARFFIRQRMHSTLYPFEAHSHAHQNATSAISSRRLAWDNPEHHRHSASRLRLPHSFVRVAVLTHPPTRAAARIASSGRCGNEATFFVIFFVRVMSQSKGSSA